MADRFSRPDQAATPPPQAPTVPQWSAADLVALGQIALGTTIVRTLPERHWETLTRALARSRLRLQWRWAAAQERYLLRYIDRDELGAPIQSLLESYFANRRLSKLQALRCRGFPDWRPPTRIEEVGRIEDALVAGNGLILWVAPFVFGPLATKMALHRAGLAVVHLSRYSHGYSKSRLGSRLLNPIRTEVESRFLAERLVIGPDGSVRTAMRALAERLNANRIVSVSVGARGAQSVTVPFMKGSIVLATGVIGLARQTGAPLVPVFTAREADGGFVVMIGAPLRPATDRPREQAAADLAIRFSQALAAQARRYPDQFWWHYDILRDAGTTAG